MQQITSLTSLMKLSNEVQIPGLGFGTFQTPTEITRKVVLEALEAGYRHIDTAAVYGNEAEVGQAVRDSGLNRQDVFVTSKLWNSERGYDKTLAAFDKTMDRLGLDYLDLYLIHWPANRKQFGADAPRINAETWRAFEELYRSGRIKAIGVSNFLPNHLEELLATCQVQPMVDQIEVHPGWPQAEAVRYCHRHNIAVEAWAPLGEAAILSDDVIKAVADKYGHTPVQVCLRWEVQQGIIPLPKSVHQDRIRENTLIFDFELSEDEMDLIGSRRRIGGHCQVPDQVTF